MAQRGSRPALPSVVVQHFHFSFMKFLRKRTKARRDDTYSSDDSDSEAEFIELNSKRLRRSPAPSPCADRVTAVSPMLLGSSPSAPQRSLSSSPSIDRSLLHILHKTFHLTGFRVGQYEAVHAAIEGRDVILRLPTGAGKTVATLLPPLYTRSGITIIIVPLIALLRQQTRAILLMGIPVVVFYGGQPQEQLRFSKFLLAQPVATKRYPLPPFVIMTPEQMVRDDMRTILGALYKRGIIARFVIDEAQCMFTWADFRPAYKEIKKDLIERYPDTEKTFSGATLTDAHIEELTTSVCRDGGAHTARVLQPLDRANLYYEVRYCETHRGERREEAALVKFVCEEVKKMTGTETGIVYCSRKKACREIVEALSKENITSAEYFGGDSWDSAVASGENGMTSAQQTKIARLWQEGNIRVIVATSAFGMGIDKPNVRFVAHVGTPKTLHDWYQDSGRAGRDGRPAKSVIFYSTGSFHTHAEMHMWDVKRTFGETTALHSRGPEGQAMQTEVLNALRAMHRACLDGLAGSCLRRAILGPFGQASASNCGNCSACRMRAPVETIDLTAWAQNALAALEFVSGDSQRTLRACKTDLVCLLHGSKGERFTGQIPQFHGTGRQLAGVLPLAQRKVSLLLDVLLVNGILDLNYKKRSTKREGQPEYYTVWRPGPRAEALRRDIETLSCARALVL